MKLLHVSFAVILSAGIVGLACTPADSGPSGSGGHNGSGGSGSGGSASGGSGSGGSASGGSGSGGSGSGGSASGGSGSGGKGSGGSASGGSASGGSASGGSASGGSASGGSASGGSSSGGSGEAGSGSGSGGSASGGAGGRASGGGGRNGGGGAGGSSGGGSSGTATFTQVAMLLGSSCGTGMCHDGTAHVDLRNTTGLLDRLKGSPAGTMTMMNCKSMKLVVPNDVANSVLSKVVKASVSGCTNARMPDSCSTSSANPRRCLTQPQMDMIDSWIAAGATM